MTTTPCPTKHHAVLKAAARVFLAHGYSAATTDMIQREAGVSKATLYACHPNKETLFAAVIEHECAEMARSVQALTATRGDIARTLTELGHAYLRIILSPVGLALFRVVVADAPRFPQLARHFYLAGPKAVGGLVAAQLTQAAQAGEIDVQAVGLDAAAGLFLSLLRGEGQLECLTHPATPPSAAQLDRWVELAVATFLRAFGSRA
jgi:AcrR family transcriptional regulator